MRILSCDITHRWLIVSFLSKISNLSCDLLVEPHPKIKLSNSSTVFSSRIQLIPLTL